MIDESDLHIITISCVFGKGWRTERWCFGATTLVLKVWSRP
jgi:hypothetical protein